MPSADGLDDAAQAAGIDRIALRILAVVPDVADRRRVDDARRPDQVEQVVLRVASGRMRELGHEGLDREGVRDVRHRAEPADAGMRHGLRVLGPEVRDREGRVDEAHAELERQLVLRVGREDRADGRRGAAVQPRDRQPLVVEAGLDPLHGHRMIVAVMQVVLARPGDLHGRAVHRLAQEPGLDHEVGLRLAAEAAAEERHVDGDVLLRQPEALREPRARRLRRLHAGPGLALAVLDAHERRRRLHRRLREVRNVVLGLDALCGLGHRGIRRRLARARPCRACAPRSRARRGRCRTNRRRAGRRPTRS